MTENFNTKTVVSGIRPTGKLHLGNYFGAVVNFIKLQETHQCYFFIADYHSLTTHPDAANLKQNVKQILAEYLAMGLDPQKAALYVQSDLPETAELYLFLNMFAYKGELERVSTFKDKAKQHPDNINAGLLTYPCLMAADILIHNAAFVPVGKDQEQHLEMARNFAQRMNHTYNQTLFQMPQAFNFNNNLVKVPGLTAQGKMSKSNSDKDAIFLSDDAKTLRKKIMSAVTDNGPAMENSELGEGVQNIFDLMKLVSKPDVIEHFNQSYANCSIRYGDFKGQLAEDVEAFVAPIREKIDAYLNNEKLLKETLEIGKEKAKSSAKQTMHSIRNAVGVGNEK